VALAGPVVLQRPTLSLSVSSSAGGGSGWEASACAAAHQATYSQLLGHVMGSSDRLAAEPIGAMPHQQQHRQRYIQHQQCNQHPSHQHPYSQQQPAASLDPNQLSFGPMPSGPLLSTGDVPGLSNFDM
jgi:hypothetical protein